jgi:GT2 family glycosyltransferase
MARMADCDTQSLRELALVSGFGLQGRGMMFSATMARAALPRNAEAQVKRPRQMGGHRPSVSVIIPCYNYGRYLSDCVKSVLDQQDVSVDILLIDDASPDGSANTVKRIAGKDSCVRAICHEENLGHIATYNEGLAQVSGDYAVLLSADDRMTPGCLARATSLMERNPSVGLTYGFAVDFSDRHLPPARTAAKSWVIWNGRNWIAHRCRTGHNVIRSPEAVIRTRVLREIGGYRADLPHTADFEFWMRAATISDVGYIVGADQAYYRIHQNNMHHSMFDLLGDISGRLRAFDTIFTERAGLLINRDSLCETAHRCMAIEALGHAISAYTRGVADQQQVDKYVDFAFSAYPAVKTLGAWRTLRRLQSGHDGRPRRDPLLAMREKARNLKYALNWWRGRCVGVY